MSEILKPFDGSEETIGSHLVSRDELTSVMSRIHHQQFETEAFDAAPYDDFATVEAICEVTGYRVSDVEAIVEQIRREDLEARISARLRELEEPLYRVERPDPKALSGSGRDPLAHMRTVRSILDTLPKAEGSQQRKKLVIKESATDILAGRIGIAILVLVLVSTVLMVIINVLTQK